MKSMFLGLSLWLVVTAATIAAEDLEDSFVIPGGVTNAAGKVGYLTTPKGGIVAVDLAKGTPLWESKEGTKPLAVAGKRLAVFAPEKGRPNVFRVALFDIENKGKKVKETALITLPDWAVVGNGRDHADAGTSFSVRAQLVDGDVLVKWNVGTYYYGGAAPSPEILENATKNAAGAARVNLDRGDVEILKDDGTPIVDVGLTTIDKLPKEVQEVAQREGWPFGYVIGDRGYGQIQREGTKPVRFGSVQVHFIRAVSLMTGEVLWERAFEETRMLPPPP